MFPVVKVDGLYLYGGILADDDNLFIIYDINPKFIIELFYVYWILSVYSFTYYLVYLLY
jgi:hypothetical protein